MSADYNDILAKLAISANQQPQPSFAGISAPQDPAQQQALLQKLRLNQYQDSAANLGATPGPYGYLHDQVTKGWQAQGYGIGQGIQQAAQGTPQQSPQGLQLKQAILGAQGQYAQDLQNGVPPQQAKLNALTTMAQKGVPGVDTQIEAVQKDIENSKKTAAETYKDTGQGAAAYDEIQNRAKTQDLDAQKFAQSTAKDTWQTIAQANGYIVQKNGLGQIKTEKNSDAASTAAAQFSPDAIGAMVQSYRTTGQVPAGVGRAPAIAGQFWAAVAADPNSTGAEQVAANKASLKANGQALDQTQKQLSATTSYVNTFDKNTDKVLQLSKGLDFSDLSKVNQAYASWLANDSDPKYTQYNLFFSAAANEFAKIQSGSLGNTPVSDSARDDAKSVMSKYVGPDGVQALVEGMRQESQNRLSSLASERDRLVYAIGHGGKSPPQSPPSPSDGAPAGGTLTYDPATGKFK